MSEFSVFSYQLSVISGAKHDPEISRHARSSAPVRVGLCWSVLVRVFAFSGGVK